jgi:dihydroorotate dehydrogenase
MMTQSQVLAPDPIFPGAPQRQNVVRAMGLLFRNCIGIAAGIDRDGSVLPALAGLRAGYIEIGTMTNPHALRITPNTRGNAPLIGVNIASPQAGFSDNVLTDYRACLSSALPQAHYIVLNFSNEAAQRTLNSGGGHRIVSMARDEISRWHARTSGRTPLLAKLPAGATGDVLPVTQSIAAQLDGFVLAGEQPDRIAEIRAAFPQHGIVSVGGVRSAEDVKARKRAGCDLVQVHRAYAEGGAPAIERILRDLGGGLEDG